MPRWIPPGPVSVLLDIAFFALGAAVLMVSADRLVAGAGAVASRLGVSPVIVGAIVIGFGSSLPEMLVSVAALDQPNGLDLAIGNVIGSNIANVGLVLGASVLFFPFAGPSRIVKREGALMFAGLILMSAFMWDQVLDRWEGAILFLTLIGVGFVVVRWSNEDDISVPVDETDRSTRRIAVATLLAVVLLALSARMMVLGAEGLALRFGIEEGVVGLTILALGTSLPELGTVLASARKGRNDLVVGNILGSNLFNALGVAGAVGFLGAGNLVTDFRSDLLVMVGVAALAGIAAFTGDRFRRVEGAVMLAAYPLAVWVAL